MTSRSRRSISLAAIMTVAGAALLAVPARWEGSVVVPINALHGLSLIDGLGAVLLAVGATWLEVVLLLWLPTTRLSPRPLFILGVLAGLGVGLVVASVYQADRWWMLGAALLSVALVTLVAAALRAPATRPAASGAAEQAGTAFAEPPAR